MKYEIERLRKRRPIQVIQIKNIKEEDKKLFADNIIEGYYPCRKGEFIKIGFDNLWDERLATLHGRSFLFEMNSCCFISILCDVYKVQYERKYLVKAIEIILKWNSLKKENEKGEFTWHDHATALRLLAICECFETWRMHDWDEAIVNKFVSLAEEHCSKLADPKFYMENHNHGLDQDIALFSASIVFDVLKQSEEWKKLAIKRMNKQIKFLFQSDGSYNEHAPHYSVLFCSRLLDFNSFIEKLGIKYNKIIEEILYKNIEFLANICNTEGILPNISDSEYVHLKKYLLSRINNCNREFRDKLLEVMERKKDDKIYCEGDYAVINNREKNQLIIYSSFKSRVHKHHDDLSIILYAHGQPLLIDAGKYNYNYKDLERQYVISTLAHNTIRVDGKDTDLARLNIGKSGLTHYLFNDEIKVIKGAHCLYDKVVCERTLININSDLFLVLDEVFGYKDHAVEQVLNLAPNIKISKQIDSVIGQIDNKEVIHIKSLLEEDGTLKVYNGQKNPMRGWYSPEYSKLVNTNQLSFEKQGKNTKFATLIDVGRSNLEELKFKWNDEKIEFRYKKDEYVLTKEGDSLTISINKRAEVIKEIEQSILTSTMKTNKKMGKIGEVYLVSDKLTPQVNNTPINWQCQINNKDTQFEYAWYIYKEDQLYKKIMYSQNPNLKWVPQEPGRYIIKVFIKDKHENKTTVKSEVYTIT